MRGVWGEGERSGFRAAGAHVARRQGQQGPADAAAAKPGGWVAPPRGTQSSGHCVAY